MKQFLLYLKERRFAVAAFLIFILIFYVSFLLFRLPLGALLYPAVLCALCGAGLGIADFSVQVKKHRMYERINGYTDAESLIFPPADGIAERDLLRITDCLCRENKEYREEAQARFADMTDYYTVWAHQIKTPIASMRLRLENEDSMLCRELFSDLRRIEQYVEMVLAFLRLDSESTDYVIREYDLDGIVRNAVKKFAPEFIARKLSLTYEPLDTRVITDEKWLSFVIEQVLSNSLKYTAAGGISVTALNGRLCIRDTGMGIAPEDLPRIFEKGYTGCNGRSDMRASGIGLYLCRRICEKLGHSICAESEVGKGTAVYIGLQRDKLTAD